mgnify:FL=1
MSCALCGRTDVKKRPRCGKYHYPHKCPHGRPCASGVPRLGEHANTPRCFPCINRQRADYDLAHRGKLEQAGMVARDAALGAIGPEDRLLSAAEMMAALFEHRTRLVAEDRGEILDINPASRVQWTETRTYTGLNGPEDRVAFQVPWEAALRRRGLLGVLRGKVLPSEWLAGRERADEDARTSSQQLGDRRFLAPEEGGPRK